MTINAPAGSTDMSRSNMPPKRGSLGWVFILLLLVVGGFVLWQQGVFKPKVRIAMVTSSDTPYWDAVEKGAKEAAGVYDVSLTFKRMPANTDQQTQALQTLLQEHWDGIAVSPMSPMQQAGVLSDVGANTNLVTFDSDSPVSNRICFVGTDNYHAGSLAGDQVKTAVPDGGEVIIAIGNLDKENTQHRRQGVIDELLDRTADVNRTMDPADQPVTGGKFTVLPTIVDGGDAAHCTELATQMLKEHPNVKCVIGLNSYTTGALLTALQQAGKAGQVKAVGFDVAEPTLAGIENGSVAASIMQDQYGCGFQTVRILAESARGDRSGLPMFQRRSLPVEIVTKENVSGIRTQLTGIAPPATSPEMAASH